MAEDLYAILRVKKSASPEDIKQAYRKLARKHHPDVNPGDAKAEESFKRAAAAYEVLSDDDKRKAYDEFGQDSLKGSFDPEQARAYKQWKRARSQGARPFRASGGGDARGVGGADLADLFGFGRGGFRSGPMRGQDVRAVVDMDLRQAITGGDVSVDLPGTKPVTVRIPPGADTGSTVRIKGKGAPGVEGGPAGDLIIETRVRAHPLLSRDGRNLTITVPVTLDEAYNGGSIEIPTFDGPVKLRIPPRSQPGSRLRLRGKGIERGDKRGDFFVVLDVRLPDAEDAKLAEALKESNSAYTQPVRKEMRL